MLPNSNSKATGSDPGACMVPAPASIPVPVPYPNVAQTSEGEGPTDRVLISKKIPGPIRIITL